MNKSCKRRHRASRPLNGYHEVPSEILGDPVAVTALVVPLDIKRFKLVRKYRLAGRPSMNAPESGSEEIMILKFMILSWTMSSCKIEFTLMLPAISGFPGGPLPCAEEPLPFVHTDWKWPDLWHALHFFPIARLAASLECLVLAQRFQHSNGLQPGGCKRVD